MKMQIAEGKHEVTLEKIDSAERANKLSTHDRKTTDVVVSITHTECGRDFQFYLKGQRLEPKLGATPPGGASEDWYKALTERERIDLMQAVLAHYRKPSADPDGMKTAAVGIVENPDPNASARDKHLIYVSFNTTDKASKYLKSCAEKNTLDEGRQSMRGYMHHKLGIENAENQKFIEFHVMGGRDPKPGVVSDKGKHGICPCGQCTDRLAMEMVKGGKVFIYPYREDDIQHPVDYFARSFSDVNEKAIWATTIDVLNRHRYIDLTAKEIDYQKQGLEWVAEQLVNYTPPEKSPELLMQSMKNEEMDRDSIAALDIATHDGVLDVVELNKYMMQQLLKTLAPRIRKNHVPLNKEAILEWLTTKVETVRCVVIRTDDGSYHLSKDSRTGSDNAYPNAESSALSSAIDALGEHGVEALYTLTFDPKDIAAGVMRTLSKDGLERAYKRATKIPGKEMYACHLLLNDTSLRRTQLADMSYKYSFDMNEIYPGHFAGTGVSAHQVLPVGGGAVRSWRQTIPRDMDVQRGL